MKFLYLDLGADYLSVSTLWKIHWVSCVLDLATVRIEWCTFPYECFISNEFI